MRHLYLRVRWDGIIGGYDERLICEDRMQGKEDRVRL